GEPRWTCVRCPILPPPLSLPAPGEGNPGREIWGNVQRRSFRTPNSDDFPLRSNPHPPDVTPAKAGAHGAIRDQPRGRGAHGIVACSDGLRLGGGSVVRGGGNGRWAPAFAGVTCGGGMRCGGDTWWRERGHCPLPE